MQPNGIVRRIGKDGRVELPSPIRQAYELQEGDAIEFYSEGDRIIIEKHIPTQEEKQDQAMSHLFSYFSALPNPPVELVNEIIEAFELSE